MTGEGGDSFAFGSGPGGDGLLQKSVTITIT